MPRKKKRGFFKTTQRIRKHNKIKMNRRKEKLLLNNSIKEIFLENDKMTFANQKKFLDDGIGKSSTVTSLSALPADIDECQIQPTTSTAQKVLSPQSSSEISVSSDSWVNISDSATDNSSLFKTQSSKKRKMKEYDDSSKTEIRRAILSNIEDSRKTPDAVDGFLLQIGSRLRALPPRERAQLEIKILTDLFDLESSLSLH